MVFSRLQHLSLLFPLMIIFEVVGSHEIASSLLLDSSTLVAIKTSHFENLKASIDQKPELVNATDEESGCSAVALAAQLGHSNIIQLLCENGADVNAQCHNGKTPLMLASICSLQHEIRHPICSPHLHHEEEDHDSHYESVRVLLAYNASVSLTDNDKRSVTHFAAMNGHEDILEVLLDTEGIEVDTKDSDGWSPLFYAVQRNDIDSINLLVEYGANLNSRDWFGTTPVIQAAHHSMWETARKLIDLGADLCISDSSGLTAADYAMSNGETDPSFMCNRYAHEEL